MSQCPWQCILSHAQERLRAKLLLEGPPSSASTGLNTGSALTWNPPAQQPAGPAAASTGGMLGSSAHLSGIPRLLTPGGLNTAAAEQMRAVRSRLLSAGGHRGGAGAGEPGLARFLEEADEEAELWRRERSNGSSSGGKSRASSSSTPSGDPTMQGAPRPWTPVSLPQTKPPPRFSGISQLWQAVGLQVGHQPRPRQPRSLEQLLQAEGVPSRCVCAYAVQLLGVQNKFGRVTWVYASKPRLKGDLASHVCTPSRGAVPTVHKPPRSSLLLAIPHVHPNTEPQSLLLRPSLAPCGGSEQRGFPCGRLGSGGEPRVGAE